MKTSRSIRAYFLKRLTLAAATIFFMATLMFLLFRMLPGDPTLTVLSPAMSPEVQAELRHRFGLDRPLSEQYLRYVSNMLAGNFGVSFYRGVPVSEIIGERLVNTAALMVPSLLLAYGLGIFIGAMVAWKRGSVIDTAATTGSILFQSAPIFWVSILFISVFAIRLDILPSGHMRTPGSAASGPLATLLSVDFLYHLILPMLVMARPSGRPATRRTDPGSPPSDPGCQTRSGCRTRALTTMR